MNSSEPSRLCSFKDCVDICVHATNRKYIYIIYCISSRKRLMTATCLHCYFYLHIILFTKCYNYPVLFLWGGRGLMDRVLDSKPEITQGCGFESRLWQEVSTTEVRPLGKALDPQLLPKPEITQGCGFESRLWQEVSTMEVRPLGKAPDPQLLPGRCNVSCPMLQVCALGWVKCREHISLLIILCIIVYVTNKAHLSLICVVFFLR